MVSLTFEFWVNETIIITCNDNNNVSVITDITNDYIFITSLLRINTPVATSL